MKIVSGLVLFVLLGIYAQGQRAKIVAEVAASSDRVVKNAPFSAEAISESVQVLADGNRIVRSSTTKMYRNSEGRFRREMVNGTGGMFGTLYTTAPGVTILDPVAGQRFMLDQELKTARSAQLKIAPRIAIKPDVPVGEAQRAVVAEKLAQELKEKTITRIETRGQVVEELAVAAGSIRGEVRGDFTLMSPKYETRTEQLGGQIMEGVEAEGTRMYTTIPAGAIGNERPIEIVYERWFSKDLQMTVYSKHSDPRFGEQTYRLTNIVRSEPDPSLFTLPTGYKVIPEPGSVYRLSTTNDGFKKVTLVKPAKPVAPPPPPTKP